jgi:catechol 2,3-dioxygenase-like lactoylglutathione lyase family enzyme
MAPDDALTVTRLSAVTLATHDMGRSVRFYTALGFEVLHGGESAEFTSLRAGDGFLNLVAQPPQRQWSWWGRVIIHVSDVDAAHRRCLALGAAVEAPPRDAEWGERYVHVSDPDGHQLSLAQPLLPGPAAPPPEQPPPSGGGRPGAPREG